MNEGKINFEKYMNINLLDFCYEALAYSKENDVTLEKALTDLLREHIDKAIVSNAEDFEYKQQDADVSFLMIDANNFTATEVLEQKTLNNEEKELINNIEAIVKARQNK